MIDTNVPEARYIPPQEPLVTFSRPGALHNPERPPIGRKIGLRIGWPPHDEFRVFVVQYASHPFYGDRLDLIHWQSGYRVLDNLPSDNDNDIQTYLDECLRYRHVDELRHLLDNMPRINWHLMPVNTHRRRVARESLKYNWRRRNAKDKSMKRQSLYL